LLGFAVRGVRIGWGNVRVGEVAVVRLMVEKYGSVVIRKPAWNNDGGCAGEELKRQRQWQT
jgi:hypothetical protein